MINLDQSIAKIKPQVEAILGASGSSLIIQEIIDIEGRNKNRASLIKWLNKQLEEAVEPVPEIIPPMAVRQEPRYRPEKRGTVWMILDVANGEFREESFEVKHDAKTFIDRLMQLPEGVDLSEPYFHKAKE